MSEIASKRIYYLAAVAMVAIVLIGAVAVIRPPIIQTTPGNSSNPKTLQVTGTGTVSAAPDQVVLILAVETQSSSATQATTDNAAAMGQVMDALTGLGIDKNSISTTSYTLTPNYQNNPDQSMPSKIVGYTARNEIQVTLQDLSLVGKALDTAISAGANEVPGIMFTFSTSTLAGLQKQALALAVQDADGQAKTTAQSLGVTIIGPISVSPGYVFQPNVQKFAASQPGTPIQPGTLQVSATVQVTYQFA